MPFVKVFYHRKLSPSPGGNVNSLITAGPAVHYMIILFIPFFMTTSQGPLSATVFSSPHRGDWHCKSGRAAGQLLWEESRSSGPTLRYAGSDLPHLHSLTILSTVSVISTSSPIPMAPISDHRECGQGLTTKSTQILITQLFSRTSFKKQKKNQEDPGLQEVAKQGDSLQEHKISVTG